MIGPQSDVKDIELHLEELVLPENLLSNESLSPDTEGQPEEVEQVPYRVDTYCKACGTGVRVCVLASRLAILTFERLLVEELSLLCPSCSRTYFRHGRH
ncbi:E7 [Gammapapillomavirus 22]|uniref:Protein E7 n=2 Tax=Papillomaviridae TaxID=151340 RepID=A0A385PHP5_9PAPI|nr:E7 [Gammapapillomavirus 22]AYA93450.1 MAG: E7 protein [Human papillomavirus]